MSGGTGGTTETFMCNVSAGKKGMSWSWWFQNHGKAGFSVEISIHGCHLLKVSKFHGCQATVNQKFLNNSWVPLHRNSKYQGCQAPVLKRALLKGTFWYHQFASYRSKSQINVCQSACPLRMNDNILSLKPTHQICYVCYNK